MGGVEATPEGHIPGGHRRAPESRAGNLVQGGADDRGREAVSVGTADSPQHGASLSLDCLGFSSVNTALFCFLKYSLLVTETATIQKITKKKNGLRATTHTF